MLRSLAKETLGPNAKLAKDDLNTILPTSWSLNTVFRLSQACIAVSILTGSAMCWMCTLVLSKLTRAPGMSMKEPLGLPIIIAEAMFMSVDEVDENSRLLTRVRSGISGQIPIMTSSARLPALIEETTFRATST
jgi:hypothetical protein